LRFHVNGDDAVRLLFRALTGLADAAQADDNNVLISGLGSVHNRLRQRDAKCRRQSVMVAPLKCKPSAGRSRHQDDLSAKPQRLTQFATIDRDRAMVVIGFFCNLSAAAEQFG
jgi:hypothetical protein